MGMLRVSLFIAAFSFAQWYWTWNIGECLAILCLVAFGWATSSAKAVSNNNTEGKAAPAPKREGLGSLKYCGLRPDPTDTTIPLPTYSLVPLQLPIPDLDARQRASLKELEKRVKDLSPKFRTDPGTLVRFMRARKFDLDASEVYFREAMKWWEKNRIKEVFTTWNLEAYEQCFAPWYLSGGFLGHGRKGEMVAYQRLSICEWPKWVKTFPRKQIANIDIVHCLRSLAACEEDSLRTGRPLGDGILVEDCHGFGWDQASISSARALNRLVKARNYLMPECLSKILVVNAPRAWVWAWQMFSWILDDGIKEKVQIARPGAESIELLRKHIRDEDIPAFLGGKRKIDGDPECGRVLAPGGFPPESAFKRFYELVPPEEMDMSRQTSVDSITSLKSTEPVQNGHAPPELEENGGRSCMFFGCLGSKNKAS